MISLASRLAGDFDSGSRSRGHQYYREGLVRIQYGSDSQLEARVRGSQNYLVTLDWDRGDLVGWCDCAYCESEGPCKHLWATILSADAQGYLSEAGPAEELLLESGVYDPDDDEDEEDWPHLKRKSTGFVAPPPAPKPPAWRRELDQIAAGCAALPAPWPAKREIIYIVDAAGSRSAGALLLSICSRDRKLDGTWTRHSAASIQRHQIAHLPEPEDREILAALAGVREDASSSPASRRLN
ncbi:MAG: hypothetical protein LAQ30_07940 [Acidobacteriia bacterium]|nr:hypothetical protein [Terriglobia bacterium]